LRETHNLGEVVPFLSVGSLDVNKEQPMPRRISPSQARSQMRRAQSQLRQASSKLERAGRQFDRDLNKLTREVRAYDARSRSNQARLRREVSRLSNATTTTRHVTYRQSVATFQQSFAVLESSPPSWIDAELFDMSEGEAANSAAALNALLEGPEARDSAADAVAELRSTKLDGELAEIAPDCEARWTGALFALHPDNPDAARHFCTSARELLSGILTRFAPDDDVLADDPDCPKTDEGDVSRRARVRFILRSRGICDDAFEGFVDKDIDDVVRLFREFNDGTHGSAGTFGLKQLVALKIRVEDALLFVHRIVHL
jgi:hypothetical protein